MGFLIFITILVVLFFSISWILPIIISFMLEKKYNISLKIGRIGLPYFTLCDIKISKNGYRIAIDEVGIKSSFLNSELTKLITVVVKDVRVSKVVSSSNDEKTTERAPLSERDVIDFRDKKVPDFINSFAQFMAVHIYNISAMFLHSETPGCLLHASTKELHLDGSILKNAKSLLVMLTLSNAEVNVLRHAGTNVTETKLVEFSFGITTEAILVAQGPLSVEKLDIKLANSSATIKNGFYKLLNKKTKPNQNVPNNISVDETKNSLFSRQHSKSDGKLKNNFITTKVYESKSFSEIHNNEDEMESETTEEQFFQKIFPVIPKNFSIHFDDTSLKGVQDSGKLEYNASLKSVNLIYRSVLIEEPGCVDANSKVLFNLYLKELLLCNNQEKLIELKTLNVDAKLKDYIINVYLQQKNLLLTYDHEFIYKWYHRRMSFHTPKVNIPPPEPTTKNQNKKVVDSKCSMWEKLLKKISINFCAEISNVLAVIRLKDSNVSSIGFNRVRFMLDQSQESRGATYDAYWPSLVFNDRRWQMEFLIESFWWSLKEFSQDANVSKVMHVWGTPMYLGMVLVKLYADNDELKLYSFLDTVQLEWSLELADYVLLAARCYQEYPFKRKKGKSNELSNKLITKIEVKHFNCFLQSQNTVCFVNAKMDSVGIWGSDFLHLLLYMPLFSDKFDCMLELRFVEFLSKLLTKTLTVLLPRVKELVTQLTEYFVTRLNVITVDITQDLLTCKFEEFKTFTINNNGDYYTCIRTEDISNYKAFFKKVLVEYAVKEEFKCYTVTMFEDIVVFWSPNFHLKGFLLFKDLNDFVTTLKVAAHFNKSQPSTTDFPKILYNCNIFGKLEFHIEISSNHNAKVLTDQLSLSKNRKTAESVITSACVMVCIDGSDIFECRGLNLFRMAYGEDHKDLKRRLIQERIDALSTMPSNNAWSLSLDLVKAVFPHEHNFAEAVQNQFFSVIKWLKHIHKNEPVDREAYSCKPKYIDDLIINIKEFLFEMSDDPFEVKLRDNFELLEDEYNESLKRSKMLKEKIAELCKNHLHVHAGKVDELYANLKKKNAEIYVQRSKLMNKASPPRTRLFSWNMTDIEISILFDVKWITQDNVIEAIRKLDPESPWPEDPMEFSIFWCRNVSLRCAEWKFQLRDYPQPLLDIKQLYMCGQLAGAEEVAPKRATRTVVVDLGEPFESFVVNRGMMPLKFYYDLNCEIESFSYAFGPCWEPVIAQCNLSFNKISAPSRDPSPLLSFWDKMRLILHGRLTMVTQQLTVLLHASLDPYNTTEEMALTWEKVIMDWTDAKFVYKGDLNIYVRTASKYDDVQLLKLPDLKLQLGIHWVCLGNPKDHHSVVTCAPDKVPEYSSNQVHDSYRAFRSQNVNLSIILETKPPPNQSPTSCPILLLYGSTLRWIESLKLILSGVTRPTRRGAIFNNVRPKKVQLSRHYKKINLLVGLHKFHVCYWMSFAMHRGCELFGGRLSSSSEHTLSLVNIDDGLKHRPKAEWSIVYMNSELNDSEIWLKSALQDDIEIETSSRLQPVEKCYFLSVAKVSYGRETVIPNQNPSDRNKDTPTHRLVVYDLRGAWTKSNRNVAVALFDTFMKNKRMKKNLSTEALKGFRKDTNTTPLKRRNTDPSSTPPNIQSIQSTSNVQDAPSPISKLQSGHAANMLQQLIAEADNNSIVYSDDLSAISREQYLQGVRACQEDDVLHKNWQISLVNAQVLLKGCETNGYVILSAAKSEIVQRIHRPAWKDRTLVSKTTWTGYLECMQYYATVNAGDNDSDSDNENIMWLTVDNIQEKESAEISEPSEVPNMVGSGVSVGAVVSDTVGPSSSRQLQRIVSRCKCEFFYADYGDISVDPEGISEIPPPPQEEVGPWDSKQNAVDAFTLMHYDLDVCTNSLQYAMLLDVINNLLLYVEPHRKEALERLARMRFQLQLHSVEDQRRPIQEKQTLVRSTFSKMRRLEKDTYMLNKALEENPDDVELRKELDRLERLMYDCKNHLNAQSEELDMMLSCYKESQLLANARLQTTRSDKPLTIVRANEICFKHAQWRLTEADGQIGIADLVLSNFLYTKNSRSDDSVEHLLELGYLRMTNLIPNEIHKEVICPTEIQFDMPIEHKKVLRIFCRERPPVGGISVKEHFEINLVPLTIGLTKKFYNTMMKFCFPERDTENADFNDRASEDGDLDTNKGKKSKTSKRNRDSNFYVHIDDVEKMKERAEKNKLFVYIKIPEVPVKVSYKGTKEKNLEDLRDVSLVIPTLEYHNMTWTWLDLLIGIRNDSKRVILSQAIKQKLQIKRNTGTGEDSQVPQEEDKAKMLLGARHAQENKTVKKGVFSFGK